MKRIAIILFSLFTFNIYANYLKNETCEVSQTAFDKFMKQDFYTFDQTQDGWRSLLKPQYEESCYLNAAKIIDDYIENNAQFKENTNKITLYFHSGQIYALLNMYDIAIKRMENSYNPDEPKNINNFDFHWNDYVCATIFFLKKDKPNLIKKSEFFSKSTNQYDAINYKVIKNLIKYFDKTYKEAYSSIE